MWMVPSCRTEVASRRWPESTRFFDDFFDSFLNTSFVPSRTSWVPAVDILEKDGNVVLRAEVPGLNDKDIDIRVEGNVLTVKGEKKLDREEKRETFHRTERYYGGFSRSFSLPTTVDPDKIHAEIKNGVLTITVPQKPEVRPREIQVHAG